MIWAITNLEEFAENHGKRNTIIFGLIDLKKEIKEDILFVMKAKSHTLSVPLKENLLD